VAYAIFDTPAIHAIPGIPGIKELAHAGSEMVPPLVIATAQLLQVLDDSSVNIALPSLQDELPVTSRHARTSALDRERPGTAAAGRASTHS
jgi:hypothetical protein